MAVVDLYSNANKEAGNGKKMPAINGTGTQVFYVENYISIAAADDDGSVYRVFSDVPANVIPININVHTSTITSGTDFDIGLYEVNNGAVVDKDILADGLDFSTARAVSTWNNVGLTTVPITQVASKTLATLSAQTNPSPSYDIAVTANTVGSAASQIKVTMLYTYK